MSNVTGVRRIVRQFLKLNTWGEDIMRLKKRVGTMVVRQEAVDKELDLVSDELEAIDGLLKTQNDVIMDLAEGLAEMAMYLQLQAAEKDTESEETTGASPDECSWHFDGV